MDLIKTGLEISKTIKHVSRVREILSVFAGNGFDEFIIKSKLHQVIPGFVLPRKKSIQSSLADYDNEHFWESVGYRLRKSFEELGPGFIKIGQLLATREDLLDPAVIEELKRLQNNVKGQSFELSKNTIEQSLGKSIDEVFKSVDQVPIASASIATVYRARLKDDSDVVIKVKKTGIKKIITTDFQIFKYLVQQIERVSEEIRYLGLSRVIDDFYISVQNELNFTLERNNLKKIKKNTEKIDKNKVITIPNVFEEVSTSDILVLEYLDGRPFNSLSEKDINEEVKKNLMESTTMFLHSLLKDGIFHADLHGGNFFLLENNRIGIVDFGSVGLLSRRNRNTLISILYSLMSHNFENLVYEFLDVADYDSIPNYQELTRDMRDCLSPYMGLSASELDVQEMFTTLIRNLSKHKLYLPREWFIIFRAIITLDGVGRSIGLDINVYELIDKDIEDLVSELISKEEIVEEGLWFARDFINSLRILPKHTSWFLKEFAKNNYSLQVSHKSEGIKAGLSGLSSAIRFVAWISFSSIFFIAGVILIQDIDVVDYKSLPLLVYVFWAISLFCFIHGAVKNK